MCNSSKYEQILVQLKKQHLLSDDGRNSLTKTINNLNKQAYEKTAVKYAKHRPSLTDPQKKHLDAIFDYMKNTFLEGDLKVLDIGCGHGLSLEYLNSLDGLECHAVENSKKFRALLSNNIKCIDCDMLDLKLDNNMYQAVLHHGTLHHLPWFPESNLGISKALREAVRVLVPDGILSVIVKQQEESCFDETGRFFSSMNEGIMRELLIRENVNICELKTIHNRKARQGWQDWIIAKAIKKERAKKPSLLPINLGC